MSKIKLKWHVQPAPTGHYRSFESRGFPDADYANLPKALAAVSLSCKDEYIPSDVKIGKHSEITIHIAFWHEDKKGFDWKQLKSKAKTLKEAKEIAENFINAYPQVQPKEHHWNY
jgi:hypothetical protein